ncbi:MAG: hypothetical protein ACOYUK_03925 [Patescibacteria group bacterium]
MFRIMISVALVSGMLLCMGCRQSKHERSPLLTEPVVVKQLVYTPATHGSAVGPTFNPTSDGIGVGLAVTSVRTREKRAIVFECPHGSFVVEREDLWSKLHEDSTYTCVYVELYESVYDHDTLVLRTLSDYDFLGLQEFPELMELPADWYVELPADSYQFGK